MADEFSENENTRNSPRTANLLKGNELGQGFTSENQPPPESKSAGIKRKYALKTLLEMTVAKPIGKKQREYFQEVANYFDCGTDEVNTKMLMEFAMMQKAIINRDPKAYQVVMDRAYGKARQIPDEPPPPPPTDTADDVQKSVIDLGDGMKFEL